jgi:hypothetical protein
LLFLPFAIFGSESVAITHATVIFAAVALCLNYARFSAIETIKIVTDFSNKRADLLGLDGVIPAPESLHVAYILALLHTPPGNTTWFNARHHVTIRVLLTIPNNYPSNT